MISVIIPTREITEEFIAKVLPVYKKIKFSDFEVIVLPNSLPKNSRNLSKKYSFLRLFPTGKVTRPALKRDIGAHGAHGKILAFIDDDAYPSIDWLKQAVDIFQKKNVAAACGPGILPKKAALWEKVFDEILKTWVGSGGYGYRFMSQKGRYVDDYPSMNFLIKKSLFEKLGGFNNDYWPGEDSKLCEDLVYKLGKKIYYDPKVLVYHHRRNNLMDFLRQHGQYGFHRGAFFVHGDRNSRKLAYLVPTIFIAYLLTLPISAFYPPSIIYLILLIHQFASSLKNTNRLKIAVFSVIVLFLMHLVYGVKFVQGLIVGFIKKEKIYS